MQDAKQRIIAYAGKRLNDAQLNTALPRRTLAVILDFKNFDTLLTGNKVNIVTGHVSFKWPLTLKKERAV